jgi:sugar/nucleoside kinase (ribokinase family)
MAGDGCLAVQGREVVRVYAPKVQAIDGCGAGATFSAGYVYGFLNGWSLLDTVRFATAAASLKVTRAGLEMFSVAEIQEQAATLRFEQSTLAGAASVAGISQDEAAPAAS